MCDHQGHLSLRMTFCWMYVSTEVPTFDDIYYYARTTVAPGLNVGERFRTAVGASGDIRHLKFARFEYVCSLCRGRPS